MAQTKNNHTKFALNEYSVLSFEDQLQLQEEINNRSITFIFDKLTKDQFCTILQRAEKINELNNPDFFIDGRGIYQISFTVYKSQQEAIDKILELQKELFPKILIPS